MVTLVVRALAADVVAEDALPTDPAVDAFHCGDEEVEAYFHGRQWFRPKGTLATFAFHAANDGPAIGYVTVAGQRVPHPTDASAATARYLTVYALGVAVDHQGVRNPGRPRDTFAVSILRMVEDLARAQSACVGLSLWVRANNARAIGFYRKVGFVADAGGPTQRDDGAPHLTMRKALAR
jgi:ribosomal protein S18 acetylase RimI-like enzyme